MRFDNPPLSLSQVLMHELYSLKVKNVPNWLFMILWNVWSQIFLLGSSLSKVGGQWRRHQQPTFISRLLKSKSPKRKIMRNLWGFCNFSKTVNVIPKNFQLGSKANKIWERSRKKISWIDGLIYSSANITKNQNKFTPKMKTHIRKCL